MSGIAENGLTRLEMDGMAEMDGNGYKRLKLAGNGWNG